MKCAICRHNETHRHACDPCLTDTRRRLRELELYAWWLTLPAMLEPTRGTTGRRTPGYGSRPPLRLDALAMTDPRSSTEPPPFDVARGIGLDEDQDSTWPIVGTLHTLANHLREHCGDRPTQASEATLYGEIGYILGHLDAVADDPGIVEFVGYVRRLHAQARAAAGDLPEGRRLATCCSTEDCGGDVYPAQHNGSARCKRCGRTYTGLDLARLGAQQEAG